MPLYHSEQTLLHRYLTYRLVGLFVFGSCILAIRNVGNFSRSRRFELVDGGDVESSRMWTTSSSARDPRVLESIRIAHFVNAFVP